MKTQYLILKRAPAPALCSPPEFSVLCVRLFLQQILLPFSITWTTLGVYNPELYKKQIFSLTLTYSDCYIQVTWKIVFYFLFYNPQ